MDTKMTRRDRRKGICVGVHTGDDGCGQMCSKGHDGGEENDTERREMHR